MKKEIFDYAHYLASKKAIDDQSLNPDVWRVFSDWLSEKQGDTQYRQGLNILEAGAGTGSMIIRLLEAGLLQNCIYTAVELQPEFRESARESLDSWCQDNDTQFQAREDALWLLNNDHAKIEIHWISADLLQIEHLFPPESFDLLLGHAVIDLLPVPEFLPRLLDLLTPDGGCYVTINYAGDTVFLPPHPLDESVMWAYHQDMDKRFPDLDWQASQTGQLLGPWFVDQGYQLLAQGPSDWRLETGPSATNGHKRFLANILDTIESALPALEDLPEWLACRRGQLREGTLQFRAANRDYFCLAGNGWNG